MGEPSVRGMARRLRLTLVGLVGLVLLAGCGDKLESTPTPLPTLIPAPTDPAVVASSPPGDPLRQPPGGPGTPIPNDGDEASGCWTAAQRTSDGRQTLQWSAPATMVIDPARQYTAVLDTSKGAITVQLLPEAAPVTVNNFVCLARAGYYTNVPFHRIIAGFVIQGGDPTGTGGGSPGYQFADEPVIGDYTLGSLAMANSGPNTNGSQFFIIIGPQGVGLPKQYNHFGRVIEGQAAVDAIAAVPTTTTAQGQQDVPVEPVTLNSVTIFEH